MSHNSTRNFSDAALPKISDSSNLSEFLINNYHTEEEFDSLFDDLREGQIPEVEFNERSVMFSETLPINFFNHLTLEKGKLDIKTFFTPSQQFVMKYIQKTLHEMKDNEFYDSLLRYFADRMTPQHSFHTSLFRFCGEVTVNKSKKIGIFTNKDTIEVYGKDSLFSSQQTFSLDKFPHQSKDWEQTMAELENGIFSPLIAVFRSFSSLNSWDTLPIEAYSGFINYITSPDLIVTSQILHQDVDDIDIPLMKIFMHKNLHRRLLKYCIYDDVFSTEDTSLLMRRNSKEAKIVVDFLTDQIQPLIKLALNPIKEEVCRSPDFDFTSTDKDTFNIVKNVASTFISHFINILPTIPSSIRYVCSVINEACQYKFENNGYKGVFMAFFFRVIFPIFCQPRPTDPPDLHVNIKKMAAFGKIMTYIFVGEQGASLSHFAEIAQMEQKNVNIIFENLIVCYEQYDFIHCPSFKTACLMVDQIRKKCQKKASDLIFDYHKPSQILIRWLDSIVKY